MCHTICHVLYLHLMIRKWRAVISIGMINMIRQRISIMECAYYLYDMEIFLNFRHKFNHNRNISILSKLTKCLLMEFNTVEKNSMAFFWGTHHYSIVNRTKQHKFGRAPKSKTAEETSPPPPRKKSESGSINTKQGRHSNSKNLIKCPTMKKKKCFGSSIFGLI